MPELKAAPSVLAFRHVTAHAPDGTTLLDDVSFAATRGSLIAVVGPTGAGKTSLARALTGALPVADGSIHVEGKIAFVPQHDTVHLGLSLALSLWYAAALRCPELTADQRVDRVHTVMTELGLQAHADTVVGDLSVGQRKRANVAAQLLGDPDVLVLDEPTAGLDPGYERVVLTMLRELADSGRTVITVTHSVDALRACDRVLFLAAGGSVAFFGPPKQAAKYFKLSDPADVFIALDTAPRQSWQDAFRASALYTRYVHPVVDSTADTATSIVTTSGSLRQQTSMLVRRHADLLRADRRHLLLLAAQAPVIGALLWAVLPSGGLVPTRDGGFGPHAAIVVMFLVLSTTWLGVTNAVREIVKERSIVRSEVGAGLSPRAYVAAKATSLGGITMLQSAFIAFIATARQGAPAHGVLIGSARIELIAVAAVAGFAATALGLAISANAKSPDKALAVLPMTLVVQLVLAGEWAQDARMPLLRQVRSLVGARWGMEAMEGALRGDAGQWWTALAALVALAGLGLTVATMRVTQATGPARLPRSLHLPTVRVPQMPRVSTRVLAGLGTAAAVTMSLAAGGTGVMALASGHHAAPSDLAAARIDGASPQATKKATTVQAPLVVTTPDTTPTTVPAPPVAPATTPVTTKTKVAKVVDTVTDAIPQTTDVSIPVNPPEIVTPAPTTPSNGGILPSKPVAAPASTTPTTTNPWAVWMKFFNPFAPASK